MGLDGDIVEDTFESLLALSDHHYFCKLSTLTQAIGSIVVLFWGTRLTLELIKYTRLYLINQLCASRLNLRQKYGQWALITGSTDGIGLAMARRLARSGMSIIVVGRNEQKLARTRESLAREANAGEIITVRVDLAQAGSEAEENYKRIRDQIDPDNRDIGILMNNAGSAMENLAKFHHFQADELVQVINVNSVAPVLFTRMLLPGMLRRGRGLILNSSTAVAETTVPYTGLYQPTKMFLLAFTKYLQLEYADSPLDIVCLRPGIVLTNLFTHRSDPPRIWPFCLKPESYAKTALNALATPYKMIAGTLFHELSMHFCNLLNYLNVFPSFAALVIKSRAKPENMKMMFID